MRNNLNMDDALLDKASRLAGISEKTALVRAWLEALVARGSARRLACLGGTQPDLRVARRRRSPEKP